MKKSAFLILCCLPLAACFTKNDSGRSSVSHNQSIAIAPASVSIDFKNPTHINSANVSDFKLKGQCSEEGQPVKLTIGGVSPQNSPVCSNKTWAISLDLTNLSKMTGPVTIIVHHSKQNDTDNPSEVSKSMMNTFICPQGFVSVPLLEGYTTHSFCVAKYEIKIDDSDHFVSQAEGAPYVHVNRNKAIANCASMGEGYDLITNDEWQAIARNIEQVDSNWQQGIVGSGVLNKGYSGQFTTQTALAASPNDSKGCFEMPQACDNSTWGHYKRTHTLSNGQIIWDLSGNVSEWVKDNNNATYGSNSQISKITNTTHTVLRSLNGGTTETARTAKEQFGPQGDYGLLTDIGLGTAFLNYRVGGVIRGGTGLKEKTEAGIFAVFLNYNTFHSDETLGFRCAYHP